MGPAFDLSGGGVKPPLVEDDPTLVTGNFYLGVGKGKRREGKGKREGRGREGPHCFLDKSNPDVRMVLNVQEKKSTVVQR